MLELIAAVWSFAQNNREVVFLAIAAVVIVGIMVAIDRTEGA